MSDSRSPAIYMQDNPGKTKGSRFRNVRWTKDMKTLEETNNQASGNVTQNVTPPENGGEVTTDTIRNFFDT